MVCDKVVWQRWCVKEGVSKMVCVKDGVRQSGVWKMVCERWCVKDNVLKMVCDKVVWKMVCERERVTKLCVKDGVW